MNSFTLKLRPKEEETERGLVKTTKKEFRFSNYMAPFAYHSIAVTTTEELKERDGGKVVKSEKKTEIKKAYKWVASEEGKKGEEWWATYRYQLEAFVDKVKKREGSGVWVTGEESIKQMEMIDATYEKAGLPVRPTSKAIEKDV